MRRSGFAMIMAILLLLFVAAMSAVMISLTAQSTKSKSDTLLREQAYFLARSATEYALLAISGHDRTATNSCINEINSQYLPDNVTPMFDINTTIWYVGLGGIANCNSIVGNINTPESNGTIILDVTVSSNDAYGLSEPITYHRRTMQKP